MPVAAVRKSGSGPLQQAPFLSRTSLTEHCGHGWTHHPRAVRPKMGVTPGIRRPHSSSSIDTALPLDRSSSCCVRAVRAHAFLERHGPGRPVVAEAHDVTHRRRGIASDRGSGPRGRLTPCRRRDRQLAPRRHRRTMLGQSSPFQPVAQLDHSRRVPLAAGRARYLASV